ncbi:MAG: MFS transporter [Gammaproteobacteria bacterium]|nr:MFS transporter [Gammaproteobacteria bacterium]
MPSPTRASELESPYAWLRLAASVLLMGIGSGGMYAVMVVLPTLQTEFHIARAGASFPFTATMLGFAAGGLMMGRLVDRWGVFPTLLGGALAQFLGFFLAAHAQTAGQFALCQAVFIGFLGCSTTFSPLLSDISHWFAPRRGIAVAICASGNYLGGAVWPPLTQHLVAAHGWRTTYEFIGLACVASMVPIAFLLRRPSPIDHLPPARRAGPASAASPDLAAGLSPRVLQALLCVAGVACCVAMSMPQVHLVALCGDLGFGPARGAEMLSLMLGCGIISRLASGFVADRIGGLRTLIVGSTLQGVALLLFLPANGLVSLYVVSALFGLFQGGIVPSYAIVIREYFPAAQAGTRVAMVVTATLLGMALGGWMSGVIYDYSGNYTGAFLNGVGWNLLNVTIATFLLLRLPARGSRAVLAPI